ncbi:hypothetical protein [Nocardioides humi]|uniref:hypothetical protein n=1 Tax=Nocardioides humi TaxID=449461 RepID=UPI00112A24A5|nr:hypothetical protein [Nocardioides humi]
MSFAAVLLTATGCSSEDSGGSAAVGGSGQPDPDAPLAFDVVEGVTSDLASGECAQPYWSENSTGADGQVDFRQLDCWAEGDDPESVLGGLPELIQTVVWVEFDSADEARTYADGELSDRTVLVAGPTVLVASPYPWAEQAPEIVAEAQAACGCGALRP